MGMEIASTLFVVLGQRFYLLDYISLREFLNIVIIACGFDCVGICALFFESRNVITDYEL